MIVSLPLPAASVLSKQLKQRELKTSGGDFCRPFRKEFMSLLTLSTNRRWNEFVGLAWMALALLFVLSLGTFSPTDPSFNTATASASAHNWVGVFGSYGADLLYQLFGACAFLFPVALAWVGWWRFRSRATVPSRLSPNQFTASHRFTRSSAGGHQAAAA